MTTTDLAERLAAAFAADADAAELMSAQRSPRFEADAAVRQRRLRPRVGMTAFAALALVVLVAGALVRSDVTVRTVPPSEGAGRDASVDRVRGVGEDGDGLWPVVGAESAFALAEQQPGAWDDPDVVALRYLEDHLGNTRVAVVSSHSPSPQTREVEATVGPLDVELHLVRYGPTSAWTVTRASTPVLSGEGGGSSFVGGRTQQSLRFTSSLDGELDVTVVEQTVGDERELATATQPLSRAIEFAFDLPESPAGTHRRVLRLRLRLEGGHRLLLEQVSSSQNAGGRSVTVKDIAAPGASTLLGAARAGVLTAMEADGGGCAFGLAGSGAIDFGVGQVCRTTTGVVAAAATWLEDDTVVVFGIGSAKVAAVRITRGNETQEVGTVEAGLESQYGFVALFAPKGRTKGEPIRIVALDDDGSELATTDVEVTPSWQDEAAALTKGVEVSG